MTAYQNTLKRIENALPLLADWPDFVEPMVCEDRFLAPPVVDDDDGALRVRSWRYWYNAHGIVEMENRLDANATAVVIVHPWGIDDGHGLRTPQPAGVAFFCTTRKNDICRDHIEHVLNPFLDRLRDRVAAVGYSLPGEEDHVRRLLYASVDTRAEDLDVPTGEAGLAEILGKHEFTGQPLIDRFELDPAVPVKSYFAQTASTDAGERYNGAGFWDLPMPLSASLRHEPSDLVFYDGQGYPKVRDYLKSLGVRHVLLGGYCTDKCVKSTACGYENFCGDFNVFLVGDATLATFPGSTTPRFSTQTALADAALTQMITQVGWIRLGGAP